METDQENRWTFGAEPLFHMFRLLSSPRHDKICESAYAAVPFVALHGWSYYIHSPICKMLQVRGVQVTRSEHFPYAIIPRALSLQGLQTVREIVDKLVGCIIWRIGTGSKGRTITMCVSCWWVQYPTTQGNKCCDSSI
jgi:hypothetical protein